MTSDHDRDRIVLDSYWQQMRGVIGRYPGESEEYVFDFGDVAKRCVHMIGVRRPLQVEWRVDGETVREETLGPWTGFACERADEVIERRPR
ncbi:hypothetical protein [Haloparvum sp. AD34]